MDIIKINSQVCLDATGMNRLMINQFPASN